MVQVGGEPVSVSRQNASSDAAAAPAARRLGSSRWRDPRLAVGIGLVAASAVLGAQVVAAADDTTAVWALDADVTAGETVSAADVRVARVHFDDPSDADRYVDGDEPLPDEFVAGHDLVAGELLTRSARTTPEDKATIEVPVPVADGRYPTDVAPGDQVDVWVTPQQPAGRQATAEQVFGDVTVVAAGAPEAGLGGAASRVVLVALEPADTANLDRTLAALATGSVVVVRAGE